MLSTKFKVLLFPVPRLLIKVSNINLISSFSINLII